MIKRYYWILINYKLWKFVWTVKSKKCLHAILFCSWSSSDIRSFQHGSARSAVRRTSKHLESFKGRHRLRTRWTGSYFFSFPSWFFCIRRSLLRIVSIFSSNWLEKDFNDGFFSVAAMYISSFLSFVFSFLLLSLSFYRIYMYIIYYMNICT